MEKTAVIAFTRIGLLLAHRLKEVLEEESGPSEAGGVIIAVPKRLEGGREKEILLPDAHTWVENNWKIYKRFVFVSALGIAVRLTAPCLKDKLTDPAVVVLDEKGKFVIPVVSGHVGGANALAVFIAGKTGALSVITTATDVEGVFAVDVFARKNGLLVEDRQAAKAVSAALLEGTGVGFYSEFPVKGRIPQGVVPVERLTELENFPAGFAIVKAEKAGKQEREAGRILFLTPRDVILGIGCKKGMPGERIFAAIRSVCRERKIHTRQIKALASIDLKKEEAGILETAAELHVPFFTYPPEELRTVRQVSRESDFVRSVTGVGNVCERAAVYCAGQCQAEKIDREEIKILLPKTCYDGITLAAVKIEWSVQFE